MEGVTLFGGILEHLETNLAEFLEKKESVIDNEFEAIFDLFMHQYKEMTRCAFHETNENCFFLALEHTNLFYEYSLLYRIKNCSVLDYIRSEAGKFEIFKKAKKNDKDLLTEYNQEKVKNDIETLRAKERLIEANLLQFFQSINP